MSDEYKPTNSPAECPGVGSSWGVKGNVLPPKPDSELCDCMFEALSCVPSDDTEAKEYGDMFGYICSENPDACKGINGNTKTGVYGAYSMCNAKQQLGYVLNEYYNAQNQAKSACDFKGKATIQEAKSNDKCAPQLAAASSANEVAATATGADSSTPTGSGSDDKDNAAAGLPIRNLFVLGDLAVGMYVAVAAAVGASMVLL